MELIYELKKLGLSEKEAKVYLANLELASSSVQTIGKKAEFNRATTYGILDSLIKKGLCSTFTQGNKTHYVASEPEFLTGLFEVQKKEIEEREKYFISLLPKFKLVDNNESGKPTVQFFEGKQGLLSCYHEFVLNYDPEKGHPDSYSIYDRDLADEYFTEREKKQFREFRVKNKMRVKAIYAKEKGQMEHTPDAMRVKIPKKEFPLHAHVAVHGQAVRFLIFGEKPSAILIKNPKVALTLQSLFKLAWEAVQARQKKET